MKILDFLNEKSLILDLGKDEKGKVLEKLVSHITKNGDAAESKKITEALIDREKIGSTGIGNGVAIPHAKTDAVDSLRVLYAYSREGVDYDSVDEKPAHFFFLVVSPPAETPAQLRLLARISRLMGNRLFRKELEESDSAESVLNVIKRYD